ncbi:hypothetical protein LCGC14_1677150 [marine sediment metagenome]|uniref:Uncharacterized protein n=1 Tax=marine sediment metagenome TaxID=412755 RepID=A0A0F9K5C4_9ZZZZ
MRLIEKAAARFDNTKIWVHYRKPKDGRSAVFGRHIWIGSIFKMGNPNLKPVQYLGLGNSLMVTINYPDHVRDIVTLAADFPYLPTSTKKESKTSDSITWFSKTKCTVRTSAVENGTGGIRFFIPGSVWGGDFPDELNQGVLRVKSHLSLVSGNSGGMYHVIIFPSISRKWLLSRHMRRKP